jgi:hypothetical protein
MVDIAYTGLACVEILYGKLGVGGTHTVLSLNRVLYCLYVLYSTPHRPTALSIIASVCDETDTTILVVYAVTLLYDKSVYENIGYEKYIPMVYGWLFQLGSTLLKYTQ